MSGLNASQRNPDMGWSESTQTLIHTTPNESDDPSECSSGDEWISGDEGSSEDEEELIKLREILRGNRRARRALGKTIKGRSASGTPGLPPSKALPTRKASPELNEYDDKWVTTPWTVVISIKKGDIHITHRVLFNEWSNFLDLVCGSKRERFKLMDDDRTPRDDTDRQGDDETEYELIVPVEDVEDTIIAALSLGFSYQPENLV
ncbi:hypothetical protein GGR58DRAFT_208547 [Xylaria digitata]|nr:hypothetical protein GGR58DRAFT_208547 [Xylaria digitata]